MSRFRAVLLAIGGLAIVAAALLAWRARQGGTPRASLQRLVDGVRAKDQHAIEQYLDVRRTAESVVDEAIVAAQSSSEDAGQKPLLVPVVEQSIWIMLVDSSVTGRYQGIADVQQRDDTARVGVRIRLDDVDAAVLVHLRMERAAGQWRVVGVEGLGPYMRAGFERRRGRAYEAEMRSDLRNLMSAEERYFAEHGTYVAELRALPYFSPTPGVRIEILEVNRGGWRAVAREQNATSECRIAVGTSVPPGAVEREPTCSRPGGR